MIFLLVSGSLPLAASGSRDPIEGLGWIIQLVCMVLLCFLLGVLALRWALGTSALLKHQRATNQLLTEIRDRLASR